MLVLFAKLNITKLVTYFWCIIMKVNARKVTAVVAAVFLLLVASPLALTVSAQRYSWNTLTVTMSLPGAGTITPGTGSYIYGDNLVVRVYTNPGYSFDGWYLNGVYQGKLSSIPITMNQNHELHAVFSKRVAFLTINSNPVGGGTIAPGTGVWNYTSQDNVVIKEFPSSGYTFSGWYLDGVYLGAGTSITVTMDQDHQLSAYFAGGDGTTPTPEPTPSPTPEPTPTPAPNLPKPELNFYCTSSTKYSGFNVKIEGMLTYQGVGLSGAGMRIAYSVTGGATWQDLAYVNTDDEGSFSCVWMPSASGNYAIRATWMGDNVTAGVSETVNFAVTAPDEGDEDANVFTLTSNSTLTSLAFDSTENKLSFGVSGPDGTAGYVQVCVPKSLLSDASRLRVMLDDSQIDYATFEKDNVWLITIMYSHSSHDVVMTLNAEPSGLDIGGSLSNPLILGAIIAVLVAVIAVLVIVNLRKGRVKTA